MASRSSPPAQHSAHNRRLPSGPPLSSRQHGEARPQKAILAAVKRMLSRKQGPGDQLVRNTTPERRRANDLLLPPSLPTNDNVGNRRTAHEAANNLHAVSPSTREDRESSGRSRVGSGSKFNNSISGFGVLESDPWEAQLLHAIYKRNSRRVQEIIRRERLTKAQLNSRVRAVAVAVSPHATSSASVSQYMDPTQPADKALRASDPRAGEFVGRSLETCAETEGTQENIMTSEEKPKTSLHSEAARSPPTRRQQFAPSSTSPCPSWAFPPSYQPTVYYFGRQLLGERTDRFRLFTLLFEEGDSLLLIAIKNRCFDAALTLIAEGVDVNGTNAKHSTVLMELCKLRVIPGPVMQSLLASGVDVHAKDIHGKSALDYITSAIVRDIMDSTLTQMWRENPEDVSTETKAATIRRGPGASLSLTQTKRRSLTTEYHAEVHFRLWRASRARRLRSFSSSGSSTSSTNRPGNTEARASPFSLDPTSSLAPYSSSSSLRNRGGKEVRPRRVYRYQYSPTTNSYANWLKQFETDLKGSLALVNCLDMMDETVLQQQMNRYVVSPKAANTMGHC